MKQVFILVAAGLLLGLPAQAVADSLQEFWTKRPPVATYTSGKSTEALELCLGFAMSDWGGHPYVLHGERVVLVSVAPGSIAMSVRITDRGADRLVEVAAAPSLGGAWARRGSHAATSCI